MPKVVLVGSPNVGKSVIFNYLTGQYVTVSNYPGTTVEITRGQAKIKGEKYEVIDTPGMYSLIPITEEERAARKVLCQEKADIVVHVIDAKNLRRMLNLTIQLIESGVPLIVAVNLMDEAQRYGISLNLARLSRILNVPVIPMSAIRGIGLELLKHEISHYKIRHSNAAVSLSPQIEQVVTAIASMLKCDYGVSQRMAALLLIQNDSMVKETICREKFCNEIIKVIKDITAKQQDSMEYTVTFERQMFINSICSEVMTSKGSYHPILVEKLGKIVREPITGIPILCVVLFLGIYQFVGKFGAGYLVEYIDNTIFKAYISPIVENVVYQNISWEWLQSLIIGKYGIFSLGFHYAFIIILPIVSTFFFMFAILEDSGYLPRLAMLADLLFKKIGLNGRAVIPFSLGLGCGTMAVMVISKKLMRLYSKNNFHWFCTIINIEFPAYFLYDSTPIGK